jgi:cell division protein FtsQ
VATDRNRRRVDRRAGADSKRPSLPKPLRSAATFFAGLVLTGVGTYHYLTTSESLSIRTIRFEELSRTREAELIELSPVKVGDNILTASVVAMEQALQKSPWVKQVDIRRRLPSALEVRVVERQAVALVDLGGLYLVDAQAQVFKRAMAGDGLDLPILTGFTRDEYVKRRAEIEPLMAGALALVENYSHLRMAKNAPVSEVHIDPDQGVTLYLGESGTEVRLGIGDLPAKLERLQKITSVLSAEGKKPEVLHLDNRAHPSWVTVRMASAGTRSEGRGGTSPRGR